MVTGERVAVFWDYENCPPASGASALSGFNVVQNIRTLAHSYGSITTFKAYAEFSRSSGSSKLRVELQSSGVSLTDCPHDGKKDVADKMIIVDMMAYIVDHQAPATIILITGDRDFAYVVSVLRLRQYRVILVTPSRTVHPSLTSQASTVLNWDSDIILGKVNDHVVSQPPTRAIPPANEIPSVSPMEVVSADTQPPPPEGATYHARTISHDEQISRTPILLGWSLMKPLREARMLVTTVSHRLSLTAVKCGSSTAGGFQKLRTFFPMQAWKRSGGHEVSGPSTILNSNTESTVSRGPMLPTDGDLLRTGNSSLCRRHEYETAASTVDSPDVERGVEPRSASLSVQDRQLTTKGEPFDKSRSSGPVIRMCINDTVTPMLARPTISSPPTEVLDLAGSSAAKTTASYEEKSTLLEDNARVAVDVPIHEELIIPSPATSSLSPHLDLHRAVGQSQKQNSPVRRSPHAVDSERHLSSLARTIMTTIPLRFLPLVEYLNRARLVGILQVDCSKARGALSDPDKPLKKKQFKSLIAKAVKASLATAGPNWISLHPDLLEKLAGTKGLICHSESSSLRGYYPGAVSVDSTGIAESDTTVINMFPSRFYPLVKCLDMLCSMGTAKPDYASVSAVIRRLPSIHDVGSKREFERYIEEALSASVLDAGSGKGTGWISLHPNLLAELECLKPSMAHHKESSPLGSIGCAMEGFARVMDTVPLQFHPLLKYLVLLHSEGVTKADRSNIILALSNQIPTMYGQAGVKTFRAYIKQAARTLFIIAEPRWISLHPTLANDLIGVQKDVY